MVNNVNVGTNNWQEINKSTVNNINAGTYYWQEEINPR
jgi:hypothetical protein